MIMVTTPALAQTLNTQGLVASDGAPPARAQGPRKVEPTPSVVRVATRSLWRSRRPRETLGDMPPTEALFDAINRGDLAAAKDAINRGADINGRNVLGLTPLDLSVDLGRNNISFVLLSLRGEAGYTTSSAARRGGPRRRRKRRPSGA